MKKKDCVRGLSEKKIVINEGAKKKEYVRGWSEKKMVVSEGTKKKDYVRGWSEKKMTTADGLLSPRSGGDSEASKNKVPAQHSHKKSWGQRKVFIH
ncbi:ZCF37 protein [Spatholobus suberectus]|nr:ZCF37 protein [Spatholobus suberectus]